jgi:hypothetical protein
MFSGQNTILLSSTSEQYGVALVADPCDFNMFVIHSKFVRSQNDQHVRTKAFYD